MYFFNHPHHTGGHQEAIGANEFEAHQALTENYGIELDDVIPLVMDGYVWQEPIKALPSDEMDSVVDWLAQRYA